MTAMMILMVFLVAMGPYHAMTGSHDTGAPDAQTAYTHMQTDRTPKPHEDKP